ncbi:macrophage mannose receptor 1-like [Simochromis diagramma]|uniref:macrophage mannose receptor 1-like n=1 Tax=Simochromis diagramma TaxID=43689 RepID=UPI001A7EB73E|nr:macrophage mannose receptor 1-like [Simochromis diagramma]XP_039894361.1 macrophage mannose receptor 1-like [Simochromis diagramma]
MGHKTLICAGIFIMHLMTTTRTALLSAGSNITVLQQYHFINKSLTWYEAQSFCRLKYTDLATINNMDDENQLINTLDVTSSWIGLYNGQTNRWLWSDGSGVTSFTQWSPGEPSNSGGVEACGQMYDNGLWNDAQCGLAMAYVCYEIQQDGSKKYVVYTQGQTWPNSQDLCRQKHTDLACVHTAQENLAIAAVTNVVWFGLFKDSWYWSDGTKTSFRYWKRGGSYSGKCVSVEASQQGRWIPADCNQKATFMCQGGLKLKKMVIKMKVQSDVDLTDSTTSSLFLQKLETILRDQGVTDVQLKYKRVFQPQLKTTENTGC